MIRWAAPARCGPRTTGRAGAWSRRAAAGWSGKKVAARRRSGRREWRPMRPRVCSARAPHHHHLLDHRPFGVTSAREAKQREASVSSIDYHGAHSSSRAPFNCLAAALSLMIIEKRDGANYYYHNWSSHKNSPALEGWPPSKLLAATSSLASRAPQWQPEAGRPESGSEESSLGSSSGLGAHTSQLPLRSRAPNWKPQVGASHSAPANLDREPNCLLGCVAPVRSPCARSAFSPPAKNNGSANKSGEFRVALAKIERKSAPIKANKAQGRRMNRLNGSSSIESNWRRLDAIGRNGGGRAAANMQSIRPRPGGHSQR